MPVRKILKSRSRRRTLSPKPQAQATPPAPKASAPVAAPAPVAKPKVFGRRATSTEAKIPAPDSNAERLAARQRARELPRQSHVK